MTSTNAEEPFDPDASVRRDPLGESDLVRKLRSPGLRAPRPRDAATLILYRGTGADARLLMGRRTSGHDFMPDKYVFPGGRVDASDGAAPAASELEPGEEALLRVRARRRPRAFALTCVRETFEETGLIVGSPGTPDRVPASWSHFFSTGASPRLAPLMFVGRAITPPLRHKRFDARFFMADASACLIDDRPPADGRELADLRWFSISEARELDLPNVTRFVIGEVEARLTGRSIPAPFMLQWSPAGHVQERISA